MINNCIFAHVVGLCVVERFKHFIATIICSAGISMKRASTASDIMERTFYAGIPAPSPKRPFRDISDIMEEKRLATIQYHRQIHWQLHAPDATDAAIIAHVKKHVADLINEHYWVKLYAGITEDPSWRMVRCERDPHRDIKPHYKRFGDMLVLACGTAHFIGKLERDIISMMLIAHEKLDDDLPGYKPMRHRVENTLKGGEQAKHGGFYFFYMCISNLQDHVELCNAAAKERGSHLVTLRQALHDRHRPDEVRGSSSIDP